VNQNLLINVRLKSNDDINTAVNNLTNVIQTAAWSANTPKKHVHNNNTNSLPTNIRILKAENKRARAIYQRTRLPSQKNIYNKLANALALSKVKNRSFENFLTNLSTNNGRLWKAAKLALHYKVTTPPVKRYDGNYASSDSEKAELFKNHIFNVFQPNQDVSKTNTNTVLKYLDLPFPNTPPVNHFSPSDIKFTIQKYCLEKSPGFDLITAEVATCLPKRTTYRPISLLPFFSKVLERLILKWMLPFISKNKILPNY
jgi:hypothetical protein